MPIGIREMNAAKPQSTLSAAPLSRPFASDLLLRDSFAEPLFRLLCNLLHDDLPVKEDRTLECQWYRMARMVLHQDLG